MTSTLISEELKQFLSTQTHAFGECVSCGNLAAVKSFIELGVDVSACDRNGVEPLVKAMKNKDLDMIKLLIENGSKYDYMLMDSIMYVWTELFDYLVDIKYNLKPADIDMEPLECAVIKNNRYMVRRLLESDIRLDSIDSAMTVAKREENEELMRLLTDLPV